MEPRFLADKPRCIADKPRFIADSMLGTLAKWLRALGFDTVFEATAHDSALLRQAGKEGRILLTCDRELAGRGGELTRLIAFESLEKQLAAVLRGVPVSDLDSSVSRCLCCNGELDTVDKEQCRLQVPDYVFATHDFFIRCLRCDRIYWEGTHVEGIRKRLKKLRQYLMLTLPADRVKII